VVGRPGAVRRRGAALRLAARRGGPDPAGRPAVWLGGLTPAALDRAGRLYDGWLPYPPAPDGYGPALAAVRDAAVAAGRAPDAVTPALFVTVALDDEPRAEERLDAYCRTIYGRPAEAMRGIQAMLAGPPAMVAAGLARYVDAGARHLVVRPAALDRDDHACQLDRLAEVADTVAWVAPRARAS
jgi:alkanesulfonate monooxygenase SsuD/methylene tetrahydromethanopterin reductase-like flavin-dependent oxidoreductase (luciferase family)